ncbi:transposon Tf2-6 polyprotein [Trichonephila clavipes]|nr:transposon Tf2-6 polyprotein [Trichonephila clavipes]
MHKDKGLKCFQYEAFGHKASECPDNNATKLDVAHLIVIKEKALSKKVLIVDLVLDALIDSGSQVTLIRKSVFDKLNHIQLFPLNSTLSGFGKGKVRQFDFKDYIQIDVRRCSRCNAMLYDVIVGLNALIQVSSGGPADSRIAVWRRPLFPSHITLIRMPTNVLGVL